MFFCLRVQGERELEERNGWGDGMKVSGELKEST